MDDIDVSMAGIPSKQYLDRIRPDTLFGWVTIQRDALLQPRASDVTDCISARLYVDDEPVRRMGFRGATLQGGTLCFPVLGEHVGTTQTLTLRLWVSAGPAKTTTYTEAASDIELSVTDSGDNYQITLGEKTQQVRNAPTATTTDLSQFINQFELSQFEEQTKSHRDDDSFAIKSYNPLTIEPNEMVLLYFTDK